MTGEDQKDQKLEQYLEGKDGLSQKYQQVSAESPPHEIDEAILASSRRAVSAKPVSVVAPFSTRWHVPLSIAAVVVLSVIVVFNIPDYESELRYEPAYDMPEMETSGKMSGDEMDGNEMFMDEQVLEEAIYTETQAVGQPGRLEASEQSFNQPEVSVLRRPLSIAAPETPADAPTADMENIQPMMAPAAAVDELSDNASFRVEDSDLQLRQRQVVPNEDRVLMRDVGSVRVLSSDLAEKKETAIDSQVASAEEMSLSTILTECTLPRPQVCAEIYMPVCAIRDTAIRCVTTPCDSTEKIDYANACSACSDPEVLSYTDGRCDAVSE